MTWSEVQLGKMSQSVYGSYDDRDIAATVTLVTAECKKGFEFLSHNGYGSFRIMLKRGGGFLRL